jgi:hypothetical protein
MRLHALNGLVQGMINAKNKLTGASNNNQISDEAKHYNENLKADFSEYPETQLGKIDKGSTQAILELNILKEALHKNHTVKTNKLNDEQKEIKKILIKHHNVFQNLNRLKTIHIDIMNRACPDDGPFDYFDNTTNEKNQSIDLLKELKSSPKDSSINKEEAIDNLTWINNKLSELKKLFVENDFSIFTVKYDKAAIVDGLDNLLKADIDFEDKVDQVYEILDDNGMPQPNITTALSDVVDGARVGKKDKLPQPKVSELKSLKNKQIEQNDTLAQILAIDNAIYLLEHPQETTDFNFSYSSNFQERYKNFHQINKDSTQVHIDMLASKYNLQGGMHEKVLDKDPTMHKIQPVTTINLAAKESKSNDSSAIKNQSSSTGTDSKARKLAENRPSQQQAKNELMKSHHKASLERFLYNNSLSVEEKSKTNIYDITSPYPHKLLPDQELSDVLERGFKTNETYLKPDDSLSQTKPLIKQAIINEIRFGSDASEPNILNFKSIEKKIEASFINSSRADSASNLKSEVNKIKLKFYRDVQDFLNLYQKKALEAQQFLDTNSPITHTTHPDNYTASNTKSASSFMSPLKTIQINDNLHSSKLQGLIAIKIQGLSVADNA